MQRNLLKLIGEAAQTGNYTVTMSTGAQKKAVIAPACEPLVINGGWTNVPARKPRTRSRRRWFSTCPKPSPKPER